MKLSPRQSSIDAAAAGWVAKRDRGFTPLDQDEFFHWLAADQRHGDAFAEHQAAANDLKLLAQWRPEHADKPNPDLLAMATSQWKRWPGSWTMIAAAAAVLVVVGAFVSLREAPTPERSAASREAALAVRKVLEDGSTIDIGADGEVAVAYSAEERRVRLVRGLAHFTVAKNAGRPFVVDASGVQVQAVGTAFDVRLASEKVEVFVTEGQVRVDAPGVTERDRPIVSAGQQAVVALAMAGQAPVVSTSVPAGLETSRHGPRLLEFSQTPLAQVVSEFNRDNVTKIVVDDPALASLPIGAALRSDNIEGFVRVLETGFKVSAERRPDGVIVLRPER